MTEQFIPEGVFQKVVIFNDDKVLVLKQSSRDGNIKKEQWDLPGGKVKKRENLESALKREVQEETKLNINNLFLVAGSLEKFKPDGKIRLGLIYIAETKSGRIMLNKAEHTSFEWANNSGIKSKRFAFSNTKDWIEKAKKIKNLM